MTPSLRSCEWKLGSIWRCGRPKRCWEGGPPGITPRSRLSTGEELLDWLRYLGFDVCKKDAWLILGLVRKSCEGHRQVVENRTNQGLRLLDLGHDLASNDEARGEINNLRTLLREARNKCVEDLEKPSPKDAHSSSWTPQFGELGDESLNQVRAMVGCGATFCTQLSNIFGRDEDSEQVLQGDEARFLVHLALGSAEAVKNFDGVGLVMWAPSARGTGTLLSNFSQGSALSEHPWSLHLVYSVDPICHGLQTDELKDVWKCPALKWAQLLYKAELLSAPCRTIPPGRGPPISQWRTLCVCSFTTSMGIINPTPPLALLGERCEGL